MDQIEQLLGHLLVRIGDDLAGGHVHDVFGQDLSQQFFLFLHHGLDLHSLKPLEKLRSDLAARLEHHLVGALYLDVGIDLHTPQICDVHVPEHLVSGQLEPVGGVIHAEDLLVGEPHGLEQGGDRHLPPAVDPQVQDAFRIEVQIYPRTTGGDDARGIEHPSARLGPGRGLVEEYSRRAMELGYDHPLGSVDNKGGARRHQRYFAEIHLLLLDIANALGAGLFVPVPDHETNLQCH